METVSIEEGNPDNRSTFHRAGKVIYYSTDPNVDKEQDNKGYEYVDKGWGSEKIIINTPWYCGKILHIDKDKSCSMHMHRDKHETFHVIEGSMILTTIDTKTAEKIANYLYEGDTFVLPPMTPHKFTTIDVTGCTFIEFSTNDLPSDSYRVEKGDSQK